MDESKIEESKNPDEWKVIAIWLGLVGFLAVFWFIVCLLIASLF